MTPRNFTPGVNNFCLYGHALATALPGGSVVTKQLVRVHAPPNPGVIDMSVRHGSWFKKFSYSSPHVPSVHNRRVKPQVKKVAATLGSVEAKNKVVVFTVVPCEPEKMCDWLISTDALNWVQRLDVNVAKLTSICPGLLHLFFQVSASRYGFFPHAHLLAEIPVGDLPEQVAHEISCYLGERVRVRSDVEEQALRASFYSTNFDNTNERDEATEKDAPLYVLPSPLNDDISPLCNNELRARYFLRPEIELHSDLEDKTVGMVEYEDPLLRVYAAIPSDASMVAFAYAVILVSHFGRSFRSYGRARGKPKIQKTEVPAAAPTPAPRSATLCNQSSATESRPSEKIIPSSESLHETLARAGRDQKTRNKLAREEAFFATRLAG